MPSQPPVPAPDTARPAESFALKVSSLVDAARANERAVRDLDETVQILAAGVDDLARMSELAEGIRGLAGQTEAVCAAAAEVSHAYEAAEGFTRTREALERATSQVEAASERAERLCELVASLDERLSAMDERLSDALDRVEQAPLDVALERIEGIEGRLDRLTGLLTVQADVFADRIEPRLERLERVAERMDAPSVADELADVLATNYQIFEAIDAIRSENGDAHEAFDAKLGTDYIALLENASENDDAREASGALDEGWRARHGAE